MKKTTSHRIKKVVRSAASSRCSSVDDLVAFTQDRCGRAITLSGFPVGGGSDGISGMVLTTESAHIIVYDTASGEWPSRLIVAHELAHILLGHTCGKQGEGITEDLLAAWFPSLPRDLVINALRRETFDNADEASAELLASQLLMLTLARDEDFDLIQRGQRMLSASSVLDTFLGPR